MGRRLSLTKAQRADGAGAELLALLNEVVEDGELTDQEVSRLSDWLKANAQSGLPAVAYLAEAVERVLVDGVVTAEERDELYGCVEAVLPPDARKEATAKRRSARSSALRMCHTEGCANALPPGAGPSRKWCEECREIRQSPSVFREGDIPGFSLGFKVAGVTFDGRQEVIREMSDGEDLLLRREPSNRYDSNAIAVCRSDGAPIGYVPRGIDIQSRFEASGSYSQLDLVRRLDAGCRSSVRCWKVLTGRSCRGVFVVGDVHGYMKPNAARVQLAKERPESGTAHALAAQASRNVPEAPRATAMPAPYPSPATAPAEAQAEPASRAGMSAGAIAAIVIVVVSAALLLLATK